MVRAVLKALCVIALIPFGAYVLLWALCGLMWLFDFPWPFEWKRSAC